MCAERIREVLEHPWIAQRTTVVLVGSGSLLVAKDKAAELNLFQPRADGIRLRFVIDESGDTHLALGCYSSLGRTLVLRRRENWQGLFAFFGIIFRKGWRVNAQGHEKNVGLPFMQGGLVVCTLEGNVLYALHEATPGWPRLNWDEIKTATE